MRIRVRHATRYEYDEPAAGVIQVLRVTPSSHDGQDVRSWRVDVDVDGLLRTSRDPFGNVLHIFYADTPLRELTVQVTGEVEVRDTTGVVLGAPEPLAPAIYLRDTPLTAPDAALLDWSAGIEGPDVLSKLHNLMAALHEHMTFDAQSTTVTSPGAEAFRAGHGVCQDYAHIFVAAARHLGIPARYVSGHLARADAGDAIGDQEAAHAWAEAYVPNLGWTGFDATGDTCPDRRYLRVAVGLDYLHAAPVRGARRGGGEERLSVAVYAREPRQRQD
jgi:transglutaminase-like putative cysteine protease